MVGGLQIRLVFVRQDAGGEGKSFPQLYIRPLICGAYRPAKIDQVRKRYMAKVLIYLVNSAVLKTGER
jgi:hypothetical protein